MAFSWIKTWVEGGWYLIVLVKPYLLYGLDKERKGGTCESH